MGTLKNASEKDIICELAHDTLTSRDKKKLLELAQKIEKGKGIAKKFKNGILRKSYYSTKKILATKITYGGETFTLLDHARLYKNDQAVNDILQEARNQELSEDHLSVKTNIALPSTVIIEIATDIGTTEDENSVKDITTVKNKDTIPVIDEATSLSTNTKLCKDENSEDLDGIEERVCKHSEKAQQAPDSSSSAEIEPCFDSGSGKGISAEGKSSKRAFQPILAGITGIALLICSIEFYALKIHVTVAVVVGIVGLVCMSFALYKALKPDTKLEKVEQPIIANSSLNLT